MHSHNRMSHMTNVFLALTLGALLAQAAACNQGLITVPNDGAITPTPAYPKLPTPTVTPVMHVYGPPSFSLAPVPFEQAIYFTPTIVRASLEHGEPGIATVPSSPGVAPTYKAVHLFHFRVAEYLRGEGPSEITVRHRSNDAYLTEEDAWQVAKRFFEDRNASWDDREAVLFLVGQSEPGVAGESSKQAQLFDFPTWAWGEFQYTIDTLNKAWLPSAQAPGVTGQSGNGESRSYLTGYDLNGADGATGSGGASASISLADLRAQITAADTELIEGDEEYKECLHRKFAREQDLRAEAITGNSFQPHEIHVSIESSAAWWTEVSRLNFERYEISNGYNRIWLEGADKDFFFAEIEDDDKVYSNGFAEIVATARPLPARVYRASIYGQHALLIPCDYDPRSYNALIVTVTAPTGTVHEAFFDPVVIGSAIGADAAANGALEPAAFTANGTSTTLQSLKWDNTGIITLTLNPNASLTGLALDFIALDGSVALTLSSSAAKTDGAAGTIRTIRWSSATAPWSAGDQLMLRIRNESAAPIPTPTATPTPAPTPTPTPTHTPTPTAAPPPGPGVVGQ